MHYTWAVTLTLGGDTHRMADMCRQVAFKYYCTACQCVNELDNAVYLNWRQRENSYKTGSLKGGTVLAEHLLFFVHNVTFLDIDISQLAIKGPTCL